MKKTVWTMREFMKRTVQTFVFLVVMISGDLGSEAVTPSPAIADERQQSLFISAVEVEAGKALARSFCATCHGLHGISANEELPHLAGQRAEYLYRELRAYRDGARDDASMNVAVRFLSDEALVQVAAYYASLEPPRNIGTLLVTRDKADADSTEPATDLVEAGRAAAAACAGCHGENGNSSMPAMPSLTRQHPQYLVTAIKAYRDTGRTDDMMRPMVASLSKADIENIALYYALQEPERAATPAPGDRAAGQTAAAACSGCHGEDGNSANPDTPSLAGQDAQYLANAIKSYKDGARDHAMMRATVVSLSNADIDNLSAFYSSQEPKARAVRKPLTAAAWAQRCDRCHGVDGNSIDLRFPALAGQREDYLAKALRKYQSGARTSPMMHAMSDVLRETEISNIAAYYARKQPKAVIFVRVPCD
jgi:cytochrome c553